VFLVQDLEILMDMEGWDFFFVYGRQPEHCQELRRMLREIGDTTSAEIVDDYADHVRKIGATFPPSELPCTSCVHDRDWRTTSPLQPSNAGRRSMRFSAAMDARCE
jgi:hypothetical protein